MGDKQLLVHIEFDIRKKKYYGRKTKLFLQNSIYVQPREKKYSGLKLNSVYIYVYVYNTMTDR